MTLPTAPGQSGTPCPCGKVVLPERAKFCWECGRAVSGRGLEMIDPDSPGASEVTLVLLDDGGTEQRRFTLAPGETSVGRAGADICFPEDFFLSPVHAQITWREGRVELRDLGSRNSTWWFIDGPYRLHDGDRLLVGSQILTFRRLGYPGPHPPEIDATRRLGSLTPSADIACLTQMRSDGSHRDVLHLSPGRDVMLGRETGEWTFPYDPSMSGSHAEIQSQDADFILVDAGSRNGTAVAVRGDLMLADKARFLVGDKMLRVLIK